MQPAAALHPRHWRQRLAWSLGAGVLLVGVLWVVLRYNADEIETATPEAHPLSSSAFVKSHEGTQPDGALHLTAAKGSAAAESAPLAFGELRRLFDYYLSAQGEQNLAAITQEIQTELDRRLDAAQAKKARRLLDLYLNFRRALVDVEAKPGLSGNAVEAIRQRMLAQQDLRTQYFTPEEIEGMFGFEDAMDADAVARLEVSQNPKLSTAEKQKQLAALDVNMPPALRAEREASLAVVRVEQSAADMRAKGASDDEVYRMRAHAFDAPAASRLAELDQEEAAWKRRISTYLDARNQLLKSQANASDSERAQALDQLQQTQFSADERRRLAAYEPQ